MEKAKKIVAKNVKEQERQEEVRVVKELPMAPVRQVEENGIIYHLITTEEFLTEIANK